MKIITFTGAAGGTGKTAVTANLAAVLADHYGQRVLCLALRRETDLPEWFAWPVPLTDLVRTARPLPAPVLVGPGPELAWLDPRKSMPGVEDCRCTAPLQPVFTLATLAQVQAHHDYLLIDAQHYFEPALQQACAVANLIVVVGGLNRFEAQHLAPLIAQIRCVTAPQATPLRLLLNVRGPRPWTASEDLAAEELADHENYHQRLYQQAGLPPLCATQIRADAAYEEALVECRPVVREEPASRTNQDYRELADELLQLLPAP